MTKGQTDITSWFDALGNTHYACDILANNVWPESDHQEVDKSIGIQIETSLLLQSCSLQKCQYHERQSWGGLFQIKGDRNMAIKCKFDPGLNKYKGYFEGNIWYSNMGDILDYYCYLGCKNGKIQENILVLQWYMIKYWSVMMSNYFQMVRGGGESMIYWKKGKEREKAYVAKY